MRRAANEMQGKRNNPVCPNAELLTDAESLDDGTVSLDICFDQIVEQRAALTDHLEKTAAGVMILLVDLQVLGKIVDPLCEQSDLYLGRTCVTLVSSILLHDSEFFFFQH